MRLRHAALSLLALASVGTNAGCSDDEPNAPLTGSVVFGVTSDFRPGVDVDRLDIVQTTSGEVTKSETLSSSDPTPFAFPLELLSGDLPDGTPIGLQIAPFLPGVTTAPLYTRSVTTAIRAAHRLLVRVRLESACSGQMRLPCPDDTTCVASMCVSPFVDPESATVSDYTADWSQGMTDVCKPVLGATPQVIVGQGQSDYTPLADGDTVQVETGPQGGHHIWIALRTKNLNRSPTRTVLSAVQPDTGTKVQPFNVIFPYVVDEGGYCKLAMLRFQLDTGGIDYRQFLGKELDVTATVTDGSGDVGVGTRKVMLSATTI